jgi:hypothetical protein
MVFSILFGTRLDFTPERESHLSGLGAHRALFPIQGYFGKPGGVQTQNVFKYASISLLWSQKFEAEYT